MEVIGTHGLPNQPPQFPQIKEMTKVYQVVVPMEPSQLTKEMLETYLIPLKSAQKEINDFIQRLEKSIRAMR